MLNPGQYAKPMLFELGSVLATPCAFLLKWLLLFWFINNIRTSLKLLIKLTAAGVHWPNFNQHGTCTALLFDTDSNILIQVSLKLKLHGVPVSVIQSLLQDYVNEMPYFVFFFICFTYQSISSVVHVLSNFGASVAQACSTEDVECDIYCCAISLRLPPQKSTSQPDRSPRGVPSWDAQKDGWSSSTKSLGEWANTPLAPLKNDKSLPPNRKARKNK